MLYITSPPSIVHPIRAEQKNIDKWFIHRKRAGSADLKNSRKTGSNPSKCFYWISPSLTHTNTHSHSLWKPEGLGLSFISAVVGTILEEVEDTKVYFALLLRPVSAAPGRPKPSGSMISHNTPCLQLSYLVWGNNIFTGAQRIKNNSLSNGKWPQCRSCWNVNGPRLGSMNLGLLLFNNPYSRLTKPPIAMSLPQLVGIN